MWGQSDVLATRKVAWKLIAPTAGTVFVFIGSCEILHPEWCWHPDFEWLTWGIWQIWATDSPRQTCGLSHTCRPCTHSLLSVFPLQCPLRSIAPEGGSPKPDTQVGHSIPSTGFPLSIGVATPISSASSHVFFCFRWMWQSHALPGHSQATPDEMEHFCLHFLRISYVTGNEWENVGAGTSDGELNQKLRHWSQMWTILVTYIPNLSIFVCMIDCLGIITIRLCILNYD